MTQFGTIFGKRAVALGAIVALLLAGFAALGQQQAANALITSGITSVTVANVSPPAGGNIVYKLTWTEDTTATNYELRVTNIANLAGCTSASLLTLSPAGDGSAGSCANLPFGQGVFWSVNDGTNAGTNSGTITATVVLPVSSTAPVGATIQPTFTLVHGSSSVSNTAPARTVGPKPSVTVSAPEATVGQVVTFTFTLPAGWTCQGDGGVATARDCDGDNDGLVESGDGLSTSNLNVTSTTLSSTNLAAPATLTVTGTVSALGSVTATLNTIYVGDTTTTADTYDPDLSGQDIFTGTITVWIGITAGSSTPYSFAGGSQLFNVDIKNLTGQNAPAGTVTVTVTFPPQFTGASAPASPPSGWNCPTPTGLVVTCTNTADLANNGTASFTGSTGSFTGALGPNTGSSDRSITVQAQVTFTNLIPGPVTKTATTTDTQGKAGSVSVTANPTVIPSAGSSVVQWTVTVGSNASAAATFQFKAPAGTLATNVVPDPDWSCTVADAETVNCTRTTALTGSGDAVGTFVTQVPANNTATILTRTATGTLSLTIGTTTYTLQGSGSTLHPGTGQPNVTYNLVFGWNLITWGGQTTAVNGPNGLGSIVANVSAVYTFDAAAQTWLAWFPGGGPANTLTTLQHGTAYFIYVTNPAGATLTVPAGP